MASAVKSSEKVVSVDKSKGNDTTPTSTTHSGKPDKSAFDAEQTRIQKEIDALQLPLNLVKDKIGLTTKEGQGTDKRKTLRAELDALRDQQATGKNSRSKIFEQLKALQEIISKKTKDLQAAKTKQPYKTTAELDAHIKKLDSQIDSGTMKLADEKRALQEISQAKRARRVLENFDKDQLSIDEDRTRADEIRKQLDDPQSKAASERYEAIKAELDELKKEGDEAYANRNKLFEERNTIKAQIDALYAQKKESNQTFKDANNRYYQKIHEDRARRVEKFRLQKAAEEEEERKVEAEHLREVAAAPAFQDKIEECQMLIDWITARVSNGEATEATTATSNTVDSSLVGIPKLEIRRVDEDSTGMIVRSKKGDDDENYFVGGKGKKKGRKGGAPISSPQPSAVSSFNLPFGKLTALLELSIPVPESQTDALRVIEDLKTKKAWFQANQARVTAENVAKAETAIQQRSNPSRQNGKVPASKHVAEVKEEESPEKTLPLNGGALSTTEGETGDAKIDNSQ